MADRTAIDGSQSPCRTLIAGADCGCSPAGDVDQRPQYSGDERDRHVGWISPGLETEWMRYTPIQQVNNRDGSWDSTRLLYGVGLR